jgi:hypothetical protein
MVESRDQGDLTTDSEAEGPTRMMRRIAAFSGRDEDEGDNR